jgi:hypothetical protein
MSALAGQAGRTDQLPRGGIGSSDFAPTSQQRAVNDVLVKQMVNPAGAEQVMNKDLTAFNAILRSKGLKTIDVTLPAVVF